MTDIRLITAIGRSRQIGLNGKLPWHNPDDLRRFRQKTTGGILLMGGATRREFPVGMPDGRNRVICWISRDAFTVMDERGHHHIAEGDDWLDRASEVVKHLQTYHPGRTIWIAGGARVYGAFMHLCNQFDVSLIDYDGPADTRLPPLPFERSA